MLRDTLDLSAMAGLLFAFMILSPCIAAPTPDDNNLVQGESLFNQEKFKESLSFLDKAIEHDPNSLRAYLARGRSFNRLGMAGKAIEDCNKALSIDPANIFALSNRGNSYDTLGQYDKAIEDYNKALSINPNYAFAYSSRAYAYEKGGQLQAAIDDYTRAIRVDPKPYLAISTRGNVFFDMGLYQKAIDDYTKAIVEAPRQAPPYASRAAAYRHLEQQDKAAADWATVVLLNPKLTAGKLGMYEQGNTSSLSECEKDFSFVNPQDSFAKEWLAESSALDSWSIEDKKFISAILGNIKQKAPGLVARAGNGEKIMLMLNLHNGKDKSSLKTNAVRIMFYPRAMRMSAAELEWDLAHELTHLVDTSQFICQSRKWLSLVGPLERRYNEEKNYVQTVGHKVVPYAAKFGIPTSYAASQPREALAEYAAAMIVENWEPSSSISSFVKQNILNMPGSIDTERALLRQAGRQYGMNKFQEAIDTDSKVISLDPKKASIYFDRGSIYIKLEKFQQGIADFKKSISLDPKNTDVLCNRGFAYQKLSEFGKANNDFKKAIKLDAKLSNELQANLDECKAAMQQKNKKEQKSG